MAIRKRTWRGKSGKMGSAWEVSYYAPDPDQPDRMKQVKKLFRTRREAELEHMKRRTLVAEGRYLDVKKDTRFYFDQLADRYEATFRDQRSWKSAKAAFVRLLRERFRGRLLSTIGFFDCEAFQVERKATLTRSGAARSVATVNKELSCLRHMLAKAVEWQMVERSPFDRGRRLHMRENNARLRYLTEEEAEKLLEACTGRLAHLRPIIECALNTGMRRGEILNLRWEDVKGGFIYVHKTKTDRARQIPVNARLAAVLKALRAKNQLRSARVFCLEVKRRKTLTPLESVKRSFAAACEKAGIVDFRFHDLRHTFASWLVMKGASLKVVQELLGHKDLSMTLRYSHLAESHKVDAVNLLARPGNKRRKAQAGRCS